MSSNLNYKQVANVKRRTWDVEAYEQRAKARAEAQKKEEEEAASGFKHKGGHRQQQEDDAVVKRVKGDEEEEAREEFTPAEPGAAGPMGSQRAFLKPRKGKVDVDSKVGSTEFISSEAAAKSSLKSEGEGVSVKDGITKSGVGWHCSVCDCFLKDSMTYLDHINGRKHQRKLGFSMRVERSTKDQMLGRLSQLTKEKERLEKKDEIIEEPTNYEQVVKAKDEDEARKKEEKKKRRQEKKKQKKEAANQSTKAPEYHEEAEAGEEAGEGEEEEVEVEAEGIDPAMAAMLGFSGFGGGNKNC